MPTCCVSGLFLAYFLIIIAYTSYEVKLHMLTCCVCVLGCRPCLGGLVERGLHHLPPHRGRATLRMRRRGGYHAQAPGGEILLAHGLEGLEVCGIVHVCIPWVYRSRGVLWCTCVYSMGLKVSRGVVVYMCVIHGLGRSRGVWWSTHTCVCLRRNSAAVPGAAVWVH